MPDIFLYIAGTLGICISIVHGLLGEFRVIRPIHSPTVVGKRVLSAIMFLSAVYWALASALLLAVPTYIPDALRPVVVGGVAAVYASGSLGNLWATRGKHFGWVLLAVCTGLALAGM
ncbi:MAG: hypothetical protein AAGC77_13840 [Pseudomonadota bacterium]